MTETFDTNLNLVVIQLVREQKKSHNSRKCHEDVPKYGIDTVHFTYVGPFLGVAHLPWLCTLLFLVKVWQYKIGITLIISNFIKKA